MGEKAKPRGTRLAGRHLRYLSGAGGGGMRERGGGEEGGEGRGGAAGTKAGTADATGTVCAGVVNGAR